MNNETKCLFCELKNEIAKKKYGDNSYYLECAHHAIIGTMVDYLSDVARYEVRETSCLQAGDAKALLLIPENLRDNSHMWFPQKLLIAKISKGKDHVAFVVQNENNASIISEHSRWFDSAEKLWNEISNRELSSGRIKVVYDVPGGEAKIVSSDDFLYNEGIESFSTKADAEKYLELWAKLSTVYVVIEESITGEMEVVEENSLSGNWKGSKHYPYSYVTDFRKKEDAEKFVAEQLLRNAIGSHGDLFHSIINYERDEVVLLTRDEGNCVAIIPCIDINREIVDKYYQNEMSRRRVRAGN